MWVLSHFSCIQLFANLWVVVHQAPLLPGYWSGSLCPSPENLPDLGIKPVSLTSALVGRFCTTSTTWEVHIFVYVYIYICVYLYMGLPVAQQWRIHLQCRSWGDVDSIPGLGRYPAGGHGNPLQYSCLENPMDRGAWWSTVQRVATVQRTEAT